MFIAIFFSTFFECGLLDFHLDSIEFLKCMILQSNFSFCFFFLLFFCSHKLSTLDDDTCHKWPSRLKHHFSWENYFERGCLLVKGFSCHFCPKKGLWLKSVLKKWAIFFLVNVPQDINQGWFWNIMILGLVFLVIEKELAGLKL